MFWRKKQKAPAAPSYITQIVGFLCDASDAYALAVTRFPKCPSSLSKAANSDKGLIEIQMFALFLAVDALHRGKQPQGAIQPVHEVFCEVLPRLNAERADAPLVADDNYALLFEKRATGYEDLFSQAVSEGEPARCIGMWGKELLRLMLATSASGPIRINPPYIVGDFFEQADAEALVRATLTHHLYPNVFGTLIRVAKAAPDLGTISNDEMARLLECSLKEVLAGKQ